MKIFIPVGRKAQSHQEFLGEDAICIYLGKLFEEYTEKPDERSADITPRIPARMK